MQYATFANYAEPGPYTLVDQLEPWRLTPRRPWCNRILLSDRLSRGSYLTHDPIPQAPEVPRHGLGRQRRIHCGGSFPGHGLKRRHHRPHLVAVFSVPPIHLSKRILYKKKKKKILL